MSISRNDVAKRAGVSSATVSRVFNDVGNVAADKIHLVRRAAKELGYVPNKAASSLRRPGSSIIRLVELGKPLAGRKWRMFSWVWADAVRATQQALRGTMYQFEFDVVANVGEFGQLLESRRCAGIILRHHDPQHIGALELLADSGIPYLACGRDTVPACFNRCCGDGLADGRLAGEALAAAGYSRPAFVTIPLRPNQNQTRRFEGLKEVLPETQLVECDEKEVLTSSGEIAALLRAATIDSLAPLNSLFAVDLLRGLTAAGLRVPDDVPMISHDHSPVFEGLPFRMTTIDNRLGTIFAEGAELFLQSLKTNEPIDHIVSPVLIEGDSVPAKE